MWVGAENDRGPRNRSSISAVTAAMANYKVPRAAELTEEHPFNVTRPGHERDSAGPGRVGYVGTFRR